MKINKIIIFCMGIFLITFQYFFIPLEKVVQIRGEYGVFGGISIAPFFFGICLLFVLLILTIRGEDVKD